MKERIVERPILPIIPEGHCVSKCHLHECDEGMLYIRVHLRSLKSNLSLAYPHQSPSQALAGACTVLPEEVTYGKNICAIEVSSLESRST